MTQLTVALHRSSRRLRLRDRKRLHDCLLLLARLSGWAGTLRAPAAELHVELAGSRRMAQWNHRFLQHAGATDVLAFAHPEALPRPPGLAGDPGDEDDEPVVAGEIAVCPAVAAKVAPRYGTSPAAELLLYLVHGMLHLAGEDDLNPAAKRRMRRQERRLLAILAQHGYIGDDLFEFHPEKE